MENNSVTTAPTMPASIGGRPMYHGKIQEPK